MVSTAVMNFLMEIVVLSLVFPVMFLCMWRIRTKQSLVPALAGAIVFVVFARILEIIPYAIFVGFDHPVSRAIRSNVLLYAVYQGLAFGILEEAGRYIAFRHFLRKHCRHRETAVTYGIGHGGMECILVTGWTGLQYYLGGTVLNNVSEVAGEFPEEMKDVLANLTVLDCVADSVAGVLFFGLQVGLSVLVLKACQDQTRRRKLFACAVLFHALAYVPSGLYVAGAVPLILSEILLAVVVFAVFVMAVGIFWGMGRV